MDKVLEILGKPESVMVGAFLYEASRRLWKTDKPASIMHDISGVLAMVAKGAKALGDFLDKILPQKLG